MTCDMQEPCKFLSLDSCQKRFLWTHKEVVDLALHPIVGFVLQVEQFSYKQYEHVVKLWFEKSGFTPGLFSITCCTMEHLLKDHPEERLPVL